MIDRSSRPWLNLPVLLLVATITGLFTLAFAGASVNRASLAFEYAPAEDVGRGVDWAAASLALARPAADALHLEIPCEVPGSSFATSPTPEWFERRGSLVFSDPGNALFVRVREDSVEAVMNGQVLLGVERTDGPECLTTIHHRDGLWTMEVGEASGSVAGPPVRVWEASFQGPAASDPRSRVVIETRELGTSPGGVQLALLATALFALAITMREIVVRSRVGRQPISGPGRVRRLLAAVSAVDVAVVLLLALWTILIPANIDDGWVASRVNSYPTHGDIAGIYTVGAAPMPFGYWVEWLQHFWLGLSGTVVMMRLPALAIGIATWSVTRWLGRALDIRNRSWATWVMAAAFVVGFGAWGMTLRVEPIIAALMISSLGLAVVFRGGRRGWVLIWWPLVIALALSAHPAGVVVLAPLIASWRSLWAWARRGAENAVVGLSALAVAGSATLMLWLIDSNLASTRESIEAYRSSAHGKGIVDELFRYRLLDEAPYATTLRRLSVALVVIALAAWLLRRRERDDPRSLPVWTLIMSLLLLTLTPSKWPWHVGGLIAVVALVVALEVSRIERERWVFAVLGVAAAASWTWSVSMPWNAFDLRTHAWTRFEPLSGRSLSETGVLPFELTSLVGWAATGAIVGLLALAVLRLRDGSRGPTPPEAFVLFVTVLSVSMTASTLWSDASDTNGWTFGGQNFASVRGDPTCGLGDEITVPTPGSLHALEAAGSSTPEADRAAGSAGFGDRGRFEDAGFLHTDQNSLLPADVGTVGSWATSGARLGEANTGKYRSAWFGLGVDDDAVMVFVSGSFSGAGESELGNAVGIQWGSATDGGVVDVGVESPSLSGYFPDWTMLTFARPDGADRVRLLLRDDAADSREAWVASTLPLGAAVSTLSRVVAAESPSILVSPPLAPYFPCVEVPQFRRSIVPVPGMFIQTWRGVWEETFTGSVADRWFKVRVELDPPLRAAEIGAHTGDTKNFLFVSQEYLTGVPARITGEFEIIG